jgi:aspartate/methionine/tyrosine aminotransferase
MYSPLLGHSVRSKKARERLMHLYDPCVVVDRGAGILRLRFAPPQNNPQKWRGGRDSRHSHSYRSSAFLLRSECLPGGRHPERSKKAQHYPSFARKPASFGMKYTRMPIEVESPEQMGYDKIRYNLTESSFQDIHLHALDLDLRDLLLCYGDHRGHPGLREWLAADAQLHPDQVLVTVGAASALFMIATTLLRAGDQMVVVRPNYATNIETPKAIGADIRYVDLRFEDGWRIDLDTVRAAVTPATRVISVTHPHNPTGTCLRLADLLALVEIAEAHGCWLLVDETYRDLQWGAKLPHATTFSTRVISVSSMSKAYGLPGIRIGWLLCRDTALMETLLAAKEQIFITGSVLDEEVAFRYLKARDRFLPSITSLVQANFGILKDWMAGQDDLEWVEPSGGVVCFPRMRRPETIDIDRFYSLLNTEFGTYVGPGHWFEQPRHYMRIGYGWPQPEALRGGLAGISAACQQAQR